MSKKWQEQLAAGITFVLLLGTPLVIFFAGSGTAQDVDRVVLLTGVKKNGIWTTESVTGLNYWWKTFHPAQIVLQKGEEVLLRLTSADVTHEFYLPELGIGPIPVKPGHTEEVRFKADQTGSFTYYCTMVCGECHYWMRGEIQVVSGSLSPLAEEEPKSTDTYCEFNHPSETFASLVDQGKYLYQQKGCITCHGESGKGGISNPNYVSGAIPRLNSLADKMNLYWQDDAELIISLLQEGKALDQLEDTPPVDNYYRFLAQYQSIRSKIREGSPDIQKQDPHGPEPPLSMPAWEYELSSQEIDALVAYLLDLFPWEEYE